MAGQMSDKERFVRRRIAAMAGTPGFVAGAAARARFEGLWDKGKAFGLEVAGGGGDWQLVAFHDPNPWFGGGTTLVFADRDVLQPAALEALGAALAGPGLHRRDDVWLEIDARDEGLLEMLLQHGFGIDTVITVGSVAEAVARAPVVLGEVGLPPGLGFRRAEVRDVAAIVDLHHATFTRHPEWCWFGGYPLHLQAMADDLHHWLAGQGRGATHSVIVDEAARVAGHVDIGHQDDPCWGPTAGVGIVLAEELRGRGLLKAVWRHVLDDCIRNDIRWWRGGSSQPAVLGLGRRLGRVWHQIGLRRGAPFAAEHFLQFRGPLTD